MNGNSIEAHGEFFFTSVLLGLGFLFLISIILAFTMSTHRRLWMTVAIAVFFITIIGVGIWMGINDYSFNDLKLLLGLY